MNHQLSDQFLISNLQIFLNKIPFLSNFNIKIEQAQKGHITLRLKYASHLLNHFATYQAGVYCALAEITGGLLIGTFLDLERNFLITKGLNINFFEASKQDLLVSADLPLSTVEQMNDALRTRKKATVLIDVTVRDIYGHVIARSQNQYYMRLGIPRSFKFGLEI